MELDFVLSTYPSIFLSAFAVYRLFIMDILLCCPSYILICVHCFGLSVLAK